MADTLNPYGPRTYHKGQPLWPVNNYNVYDPRGIGRRSNEGPEAVQGYTFNYNDPLEINSLADVFFNSEALDKYEDDFAGGLEQRIRALGDLIYRGTIKPIQEEGFKAIVNPDSQWWLGSATINALTNFGETLDVLGNVIKGTLFEQNLRTGIKKSLGLWGGGRYNYDFDFKLTGIKPVDFLINTAGEVVTDPFNWVSLGVGAVGKAAGNSLKVGASTLIKESAEEAGETLAKQFGKEAAEQALKSLPDFAPKVASTIISDATQEKLTKTFVKSLVNNSDDVADAILRTKRVAMKIMPDQPALLNKFLDVFEKKVTSVTMQSMLNTTAFKTLRNLQVENKVINSIESALTKATAWSTGLPLPGLLAKGVKKLYTDRLSNPALSKLKTDLFKAKALEAQIAETYTGFKKVREVPVDKRLFKNVLEKAAAEARTAKEVFDYAISDPKFMAKKVNLYFDEPAMNRLQWRVESLSDFTTQSFPTAFSKEAVPYANMDIFFKETIDNAIKSLEDLISSPTSVNALDSLYYLEQLVDNPAIPIDIHSTIDDISDVLEKSIGKQVIDASRNVRGYAFKLSQAQVAMDLFHALNDTTIEKGLFKIVQGNSLFMRRLNELADLSVLYKKNKNFAREVVSKIERKAVNFAKVGTRSAVIDSFIRHMNLTAYGHFDYKWLVAQMLDNAELKPIFNNLFDTLQHFARHKLEWFVDNKEYHINKIIHKLEEQRVSYSQLERLNLEHLVTGETGKYREAGEAWIKDTFKKAGPFKAHDAATDTMADAYLVYGKEAPLNKLQSSIETTGTFGIVIDIETYGLNAKTDPVLQIHLAVPSLGVSYDIKTQAIKDVYPSDDALKAISGLSDLTKAKKWFDDTYRLDTLPTEEQALTMFSQTILDIENQLMKGKQAIIIGHNIDDFDAPFLKTRMGTYNLADAYKIFTDKGTVDTLYELKKAQGLDVVTRQQRQSIKDLLSKYVDMRYRSGALVDKEKFISSEALFINTVDGSFLDEFNKMKRVLLDIDRELPDMQSINDLMYRYSVSLEEVKNVLRSTGEANKELAKLRLFYDFDEKCFLDADLNPVTFGDAKFSTQLFLMDDAVYLDNNLKALVPYSPKIIMDTQKTRRFFKDDIFKTEGFSNIQRFTILKEVSYRLGRYADSFRPFRFVDSKGITAFNRIQDTFMKLIGDKDPIIKQLRLDTTYVPDQYALARYLYERARKIYDKTNMNSKELTLFQKTISRLEKDENILNALDYIRFPEREMSTAFVKAGPEELYASFFFPHIGEAWTKVERIDDALYRAREHAPLQEWETDTSLVFEKDYLLDAHVRAEIEVLRHFNTTYVPYEKYIKSLSTAEQGLVKESLIKFTDAKAATELNHLLSLDPEDLQKHLWQHCFGVVTFAKDAKNAKYNIYVEDFVEHFKKNLDAYEQAHINFYYDDLDDRVWLYLSRDTEFIEQYKKQATYKGTLVNYAPTKTMFIAERYIKYAPVFQTAEELISKLSKASRGLSVGSMGNYMSLNNLAEVYEAIPKVIKDRMIDITEFTNKETSHFHFMKFNRTNIGTMASRKKLEPYIAFNPIKNHLKAAQDLVHRLDTRFKIQHLMMDNSLFSLQHGFPSKLDDANLLELVQTNPAFKLAVLETTDEPGMFGYKITTLHTRNLADIEYARKAGAVLLEPQTYLEAVRYINKFQITNPIVRFLDKYVVGLQKTGYLSSIGWPLRNFFDSMEKNLIHGGPGMLMHTFETARNYFKYHKVCKALKELLEKDGKTYGFSLAALDKLYEETVQELPKEVFLMYHNFLQQGATVGLTTASRKEMAQYAAKKSAGLIDQSAISRTVDSVYNAIYGNPWSTRIYDVNEAIEHIMRLSNYTWDIYQGKTPWKALQSVIKNHFDYTTKSKAMMYAEVFMPFLSFRLNNITYWLESFNSNPQLAFIMRDMYTPLMDLNEQDQLEIRQNRSLQYQIFTGNIVLDNNLSIKISPSMSDALQALYDPDVFFKSVTPIVRLPIEAILQIAKQNRTNQKIDLEDFKTDVMDAIPLIGPLIQRYRIDPKELQSVFMDKKPLTKDPDIDLGTAWTAYTRVSDAGRFAALLLPSVFGGVKKQYYFVYASTGILFRTYDRNKLIQNLEKGAVQVGDPREYTLISSQPRPRKTYIKKVKPKYAKKIYPRKVYFKKYTGRGYTPKYNASVQAKVLRSVRGTKMRMPYARSNNIHLATSVYKKIYTQSGKDRFHSRLVPVNSKNILWKLKESWSYLR